MPMIRTRMRYVKILNLRGERTKSVDRRRRRLVPYFGRPTDAVGFARGAKPYYKL